VETLRTFGHYSIVSEKIDECHSKYADSIETMILFIGLFSALFFVASFQFNALIFIFAFLFIGAIGFFGGILISQSTYGCGTIIRLKDNNHDDLTVRSNSYQFTDNPDIDAREIKNIMDDFEKYANEIDAANKRREDEEHMKSKLCCNKYKSVIQKVK